MGEPDGSEGSGRDDREPTVAIERPDVSEVDALVDLWIALATGQRAHDSHLLPEANRATVRDTLARHAVTGGVQVARRDGEIVGFVTFGPEEGAYEQDVTRGVVRNVYVRPAYRGEGIGAELMDVAESALESAGATVVSLEAMAANERARAFYRERGYAPHRIQFEKAVGAEGADPDGETDTDSRASDSESDSDAGSAPPPSPNPAAEENDTHSKED
ncbi:GNAT family N-acetyltransferase [Halobellus rubicundus]|uniref:GNAT family N-acetyltransferase n=1 Tax=Halobellus rubicundus TaxID=2996466 RepID=A0ABD5MDP5_9EURY